MGDQKRSNSIYPPTVDLSPSILRQTHQLGYYKRSKGNQYTSFSRSVYPMCGFPPSIPDPNSRHEEHMHHHDDGEESDGSQGPGHLDVDVPRHTHSRQHLDVSVWRYLDTFVVYVDGLSVMEREATRG